ncbi:hypothetical protein VNO78_20392 [Psophocarpus tetragonolobus]|uniref:Uncharacterized protein n=1 Tax=Psophocarpus tetragonolobus TaxID=3891 RepID=A0AAN9S9R3_PSOTE
MDPREMHLQPTGFCYKLYNFFTKALASQALKTVVLGRSRRHSSSSTSLRGSDSKARKDIRSETPSKVDDEKKLPPAESFIGDSISSPVHEAEEKNNLCTSIDNMKGENEASTLPTKSLAPTRSIKKTVSISENVEEIPPPRKLKRKWSRSSQKSISLDPEEEPMPSPRPILKVPSDLDDKSYSFS